jgi:hypothetical protein
MWQLKKVIFKHWCLICELYCFLTSFLACLSYQRSRVSSSNNIKTIFFRNLSILSKEKVSSKKRKTKQLQLLKLSFQRFGKRKERKVGNNDSSINLLFTDFYRFDKIYGGKLRIFTAGNAIFCGFLQL